LSRLASQSFQNNLWVEAQEVLKRNVELHPQSATAYWNLAHSYAESWMMEEAMEALAKAEALAPQPGAKSMRASVAGRLGDVDTAMRLYRELSEQEGARSAMRSSAAMSSLYSDAMTAEEVSKLHSELFAALGEGARAASTFKNERNPNKRLKLGLVSGDFHHQHPVNIFMQPVLARLDKTQFEVTIYHTGISHDEQTQLARKRVDHWVACATLTEVQLVRRIEADGIDIVMDLAGHTSLQRVAMYAQRVAPVQATFLGYPGSTGVPNIDWMLADSVVVPKGAEALCSEQVMRLPNTVFCYAPEANYPYPQYNETHAQRPLTFGSFNNVPKLTPHTIKLWAQVLKAVPDSRLLLKAPSFKDESAIKVFSERFEKEGIEAARLEFRGPVGLTDMMAEYADVDIALDPVPYNGGTTTLQAMWMGVPVVVKEGNNFVSRMGASFMRAAALPEWVAKDDAEYVKIAARMAKDRKALLKLKQGLRERQLALPAWNIDTYTRDMEKALRSMWTKFCKSK
jgi:protein O-GlcNAc transferase